MVKLQKTYIIICMILLIIPLTNATLDRWTLYTPSFTTETLHTIYAFDNGKAYATTNTADHCYLHDTTSWAEIQCPDDNLTLTGFGINSPARIKISRLKNDLIFTYYNSTDAVKIIKWNANTETYTIVRTIPSNIFSDTDAYSSRIACYPEDNKCYMGTTSGDYEHYEVYPNYNLYINETGGYSKSHFYEGTGETHIIGTHAGGSPQTFYEWNGISWINRGTTTGFDTGNIHAKSVSNYGICDDVNIFWYNATSGQLEAFDGAHGCEAWTFYDEEMFLTKETSQILTMGWYENETEIEKTTTQNIYDIDINEESGIGWAVGFNGVAYGFNANITTTPPPTSFYNLELWVEPNPSTYSEQTEFHTRVTSSEGKPSNITLNIWQDFNLTILKKSVTQNNIPSGTDLTIWTLPQDSPFWTSYPPATYYYEIQTVTTDNTNATGLIITWGVISGETENVTTYEIEAFQTIINGINHIYSVSTIDENHAITSGENTTTQKQHLLIFDSTNPTNIISTHTTKSLTDYGGTNPNSIRDLKSYNDIVYIGTNDELYTFTNLTLLNANNLTYQDEIGFGIGSNDGIADVTTQNSEIAWVCQDGTFLENDDVYKYNHTTKTFSNQLNINPCHSLIYDNGYLYVHRGSNYDLQIWNTTNQLSTIDLTNTISTYATADLLDIRNNNDLYMISGKKEIKKYDVTNKTNPTETARCYVENGQEITSIEALHDNEIAIGIIDLTNTATWIGICDIGNNETYNAGENAYEIQLSYYIYPSQISYELQRMNENGKFHSAENTQYTTYYYEKTITETEINNPPVINQITNTTDTPCKEQLVDFEIIASDPDNDTIKYESSCIGGSLNPNEWTSDNTFSCEWTTTGTKNINVWVKDQPSEVVVSETITIIVQDCEAPEEFHFKVIDITKAGDPDEAISGATVRVIGVGTDITDSNGYADFNTGITYQEYTIEWEKEGYGLGLPSSTKLYPSPIRRELWLTPDGAEGEDITAITIYTKNEEEEAIEGTLVSISNFITTQNRYGVTDANGKISFLQMFTGEQLWISASKEGYADTSEYTSLITNEQKTITLTLGTDTSALGGGILPATNRNCIDTIPSVYLCGDLSGDNNRCDEDSDCLSGRCMEASTTQGRKCSMFNYTLCDTQGINRGNMCIIKNTITGGMKMIGNIILDYFLYVIIFLFLIIIGLIIKKNLSH